MQPITFPPFAVRSVSSPFPFPKTTQSLPYKTTLTFGFSHVLYSSLLCEFSFSPPVSLCETAFYVKLPDIRETLFPLNAFALHLSLHIALPSAPYATSVQGIVNVFSLASDAAVVTLEAPDQTVFTAVIALYNKGIAVSALLVALPAGIFPKPHSEPPKPAPTPAVTPAGKGKGGSRVAEGRLSTARVEAMASSRDGSFELQEFTRGCSAAEFESLVKKSLPLLSGLMQSGATGRR